MASPISAEKSNQVVLQLQSFHKEKVRAREKVDEFLSQYRPRYKPKSDPCLRPILKKFKKVRDYGKHHDDDFATFRSNPKFQESFGVFRTTLARENENVFDLFVKEAKDSVEIPPFLDSDCKKDTAKDLVSGLPISELLEKKDELPSSRLILENKVGYQFIVFVGTIRGLQSLKNLDQEALTQIGFMGIDHCFTYEFSGSHALQLFEEMSHSCGFCNSDGFVLVLQFGYHKGIRDKGGGLPTDKIWKNHSRICRYKIGTILISSCTNESGNATAYNKDGTVCPFEFNSKEFLAICELGFVLNAKKRNFLEKAVPFIGPVAKTCLALNVFDEIPDSGCCVVVHCDMCYCKGIRDKGGGSKFRKSAGDEEKMVNLYFNRIGWPSSLPINEESFVKKVLQKKKMAMDEFLMSDNSTLRPGVEEFIDDAYKEGIPVVVLTTYSKSEDQIARSIVEKLGEERISKLNIVGDKAVEQSLYTQLVNDTGLSSGVDEQLAKEAIKAVSAGKQGITEEVASMLQLSVDIDTRPSGSLEKIVAALRARAEVAGRPVCDCVLILNTQFSCLNESGNFIDCSQDRMIGVVMLVAYTTCIVVGGVFCSTYMELSRAGKMTFPIVSDDYMVHSFHMQKKLPFESSVHVSFGLQDKSHILEGGKGIYTTTFTSGLLTGRRMMTMTDIGILKHFSSEYVEQWKLDAAFTVAKHIPKLEDESSVLGSLLLKLWSSNLIRGASITLLPVVEAIIAIPPCTTMIVWVRCQHLCTEYATGLETLRTRSLIMGGCIMVLGSQWSSLEVVLVCRYYQALSVEVPLPVITDVGILKDAPVAILNRRMIKKVLQLRKP